MWNVYGSTVLFYSYAGRAFNIVSIESGRSEVVSNEEYINKGRQMIESDSQSAGDASSDSGRTLPVLRLILIGHLSESK